MAVVEQRAGQNADSGAVLRLQRAVAAIDIDILHGGHSVNRELGIGRVGQEYSAVLPRGRCLLGVVPAVEGDLGEGEVGGVESEH